MKKSLLTILTFTISNVNAQSAGTKKMKAIKDIIELDYSNDKAIESFYKTLGFKSNQKIELDKTIQKKFHHNITI